MSSDVASQHAVPRHRPRATWPRPWQPNPTGTEGAYRRSGSSGLKLPAISRRRGETFGKSHDGGVASRCFRTRSHWASNTSTSFANNYGDPPGNAELVCGTIRTIPT